MQVPHNWDKDQSPFRAAQLLDTKLGSIEKILSDIKISCDQRCGEINDMISETVAQRNDYDARCNQWEQQSDASLKEINAELNALAEADAKRQNELTEEEKSLLMGAGDKNIKGIDFFMEQQAKAEKDKNEKQ